ncbi:hypothetical protein DW078_22395 [Bacteroides fragilis]|nr:hypothetical protein DW078_22395 [Bacteroides fragilis]
MIIIILSMSPFSEDVPVKLPFLKVVRSGKIASPSTSWLYPLLFEPVTLDFSQSGTPQWVGRY